jgi:hypothetical protein
MNYPPLQQHQDVLKEPGVESRGDMDINAVALQRNGSRCRAQFNELARLTLAKLF